MMVKWTHQADPGCQLPVQRVYGAGPGGGGWDATRPVLALRKFRSAGKTGPRWPEGDAQGWGAEGGQGPGQWLQDAYRRQDSLAGAAALPGEQQRCRRMLDTGSLGAWLEGGEWGEGLRHSEGPGRLGSRTQTEACPRRQGFGTLGSDVGSVWLE